MDAYNCIIYSYNTGRFYLVNPDALSKGLANKIRRYSGKVYIHEYEMHEIVCNAQNPKSVNYSSFLFPVVIGIMVTNKCNLACKYCIANNGNSYSKEDNFSTISDIVLYELLNSSVSSVMVSGGEPTLYDGLPNFLKSISHGDFLCLLDTNGVHIDEDLINTLKSTDIIPRVSLDSIYEYEHNDNRGKFSETYNNIIRMCKEGIDLRINTVISKTNAKSLFKLAEWIYKNNIRKWHIFKLQKMFAPKSISIDDESAENILFWLNREYGDKINLLFKFSKTNDGFASFVIDSDGMCFSTYNIDDEHSEKRVFGNIREKSLSDIWLDTPVDYRLRHYNKYLYYANKEI